jgi:hypothetical protein
VKTLSYDPAQDENEGKEFSSNEKVGFFYMAFKYADAGDKCLFIWAVISAVVFGASMPSFCLLFGDMIDGIGGVNSFDSLSNSAVYMVYIGLGVYVVSFF